MELAFISISLLVSVVIIAEVTVYILFREHLFGIGSGKKGVSKADDKTDIFEFEETSVSFVEKRESDDE